jgi:hypothetical protein
MSAGKHRIDEFENDPAVVYLLDNDLRIKYCNKSWDDFADQNGGVHLRRTGQVGRCVLDSTAEPLKAFYQSAFDQALAESQPWQHQYECSSPGLYREFHMQVLPLHAPPSLVVVNSLVIERAHDRVIQPSLAVRYRSSVGVITMCMHCRRTRRRGQPDRWDWVPDFLVSPPDALSHGLCSTCFLYYYPDMRHETTK